jgi:hypothetical protein
VAPAEIIVLDSNTQIWISDVYCLYYNQWYWLRLLPYEPALYGYLVRDVDVVNASDVYVSMPAGPPGPSSQLAGICTRSPRRCLGFRAPT